ncbi:MAG TPA: type II toxin-antitoxin system HicA family toxin [Candidatus Dormibacteraeota bacterium]
MKRRDLEAHLRNHGCQLLRQGANHAIWNNAARDLRAPVPPAP